MAPKKFPIEYQTDLQDCGPACLKMVSDYWGYSYTLQYIKERCRTTKAGTSLWNMGKAADRLGLRALKLKCTIDNLVNDIPLPTIVFWKECHFIVVYTADEECIIAGDPAMGYVLYTHEDFRKGWYLKDGNGGILLAIEQKREEAKNL